MLDYDREADDYDRTRGGEPRAAAAAGAVERLLPPTARTIADVACGTGIVTARLRATGRTVLGIDRSHGMLVKAATRLPGRTVQGDGAALPLAAASVDAVLLIWVLHLVPDPAPLIAEAARVLRPGGVLITTVDKNAGHFAVPSDVAEVTAAVREACAADRVDAQEHVVALAAGHGLRPAGTTTFPGATQGRSPRHWAEQFEAGVIPWAPPAQVPALRRAMLALPDQDKPRPDPIYRLICLAR